MNGSMPVMRIILLVAYACFVIGGRCGVADASATSFQRVVKGDAATAYAKADRSAKIAKTLTRNDIFYLQAELFNGSDRWCAINDREGVFMGYVLCDQIVAKSPTGIIRKRVAVYPSKKGAEAIMSADIPGHQANAKAVVGVETKNVVVVPVSAAVRGADNSAGNMAGRVTAVFAAAFLFMMLCGFWFVKRMNEKQDGRDAAALQDGMVVGRSDAIATANGNSVAEGLAGAADGGGKPDFVESVDGHVKYKLWDCVIVKADANSVNELVRCQLCGTVQRLTTDMKCDCCASSLAYYVEVEKK